MAITKMLSISFKYYVLLLIAINIISAVGKFLRTCFNADTSFYYLPQNHCIALFMKPMKYIRLIALSWLLFLPLLIFCAIGSYSRLLL